jgi:hypothetical protein
MNYTRRQVAKIGAILFGVPAVGFVALFPISLLAPGWIGPLVVLLIPGGVVGAAGMWLLIWAGLFWRNRESPTTVPSP